LKAGPSRADTFAITEKGLFRFPACYPAFPEFVFPSALAGRRSTALQPFTRLIHKRQIAELSIDTSRRFLKAAHGEYPALAAEAALEERVGLKSPTRKQIQQDQRTPADI
jgi:hypothetical protein